MKQWSSTWPTKKKDGGGFSGGAAPRLLNFFDLTAIGLGSSLAFGISVLTGHLLKSVTGPALVVSISLAGFTALVGGLCFAEFGVRFLKVDSVYAYCYLWSKEKAAFIFGWVLILEYVAGTASGAKGVIAFIDSLSECRISNFLEGVASLSPQGAFPYFDFLSLGIIAVLTILIATGMKESIAIRKLFTTFNVILLISVIAVGAFKVEEKNWHPEGTPDGKFEGGFTPFGVLGVAKGAAIAFYAFIGFDTVSITGNEIKRRKRNLPLAITTTILLTLVAYAGVGVILTLMLPYHMHDPHAAVPFAFQQVGWIVLKWIVAAVTFFGFQTSLFGVIFPLPRVIYAMANDGLLFHCLGNCQSRLRIPVAASVTGGLVAATAAALISFENLVNLTVVGALLVLTILAVNVILLRYSPKFEAEERLSESWPRLINSNLDISVKGVVQNYFNFTAKNPTNLTKRIILVNLISFCLSSIGVSVIFNFFNGALMENAIEAVVPFGILLCILSLNMISIMCQPKSQESAIFKVPLVPFLPCLSIFLNIFLMLTFESLTWIFFSSWMAAGIIPYSVWRFLKCFREEIGENSLYEINKSNAVKLCESIWKMKSDKKSFYEGAINPVFTDELDEPNKVNADNDDDADRHNRLTQVDVIQKAESVEEEKAKPLGKEQELNCVYADNAEIENNFSEGVDDKVHWECVAEIHTEDEFLQETNVLEIVDNTYNFLSELSRDDALQSFDKSNEITESNTNSLHEVGTSENIVFESGGASEENAQFPSPKPLPENPEYLRGNGHLLIKEELLKKIQEGIENRINGSNEVVSDSENAKETFVKENEKELLNQESLIDGSAENSTSSDSHGCGEKDQKEEGSEKTCYDAPEGEKIGSSDVSGSPETQEATSIPEEQNKIKEFKEKLNQLLKNQVNGNAILGKNSPNSKLNVGPKTDTDTDLVDEKDKKILSDTIKTLNKSQMRGKLELLLAKGPPKRPTLKSSFNIKMKESGEETEHEKSEGEPLHSPKVQIVNGEDGEKSSKREKIISLESSKLENDICC